MTADAPRYRAATARDAEAVAHLHVESWRASYRGEFDDAFLDEAQPAERLGVWRERLAQPPAAQQVLLAEQDARLLGFVCVVGDHDPRWGSFVDNLHVARAAARRGIGAALMRRAGAWLCERWPERPIHLLVLASNGSARLFYERLGGESAETIETETHGGARVRSCRYVWPSARALAAAEPAAQEAPVVLRALPAGSIDDVWSIDRTETIARVYRREGDRLVPITEHHAVEGWPEGERDRYAPRLRECLAHGGSAIGAFVGGELVGAAVLEGRFIGGERDRLQLAFLHVGRRHRGRGVGGRLFEAAAARARALGARRLYVSSTSTQATVDFYLRRGARPAREIDPALFALEPGDIHLEIDLTG